MAKTLMNERIKGLVGSKVKEIVSLPVQKSDIRRYCEATGNFNPLYFDEEYAKQAGYEDVIAPPAFYSVPFRCHPRAFCSVSQGTDTEDIAELMEKVRLNRTLDVAKKIEFFKPVQPGDIVRYIGEITEITEKQSRKLGPVLSLTFRRTATNQNDELVCIETIKFYFF